MHRKTTLNLVEVNLQGKIIVTLWENRKLIANSIPLSADMLAIYKATLSKRLAKLKATVVKTAPFTEAIELSKLLLDLYYGRGKAEVPVTLQPILVSERELLTLKKLALIPRGYVISYSALSKALNLAHPRRAALLLKKNPYPLILPCHRVVMKNGFVGGYLFGLSGWSIKAEILRREGVKVSPQGYIPRSFYIDNLCGNSKLNSRYVISR